MGLAKEMVSQGMGELGTHGEEPVTLAAGAAGGGAVRIGMDGGRDQCKGKANPSKRAMAFSSALVK